MVRRHSLLVAVAGVVGALALLPVSSAQGTARSPAAAPRPGAAFSAALHIPSPRPGQARGTQSLTGCEHELDRATPRLVVVGASFTAGVGSGGPGRSWAVQLARLLHWDAVVYGDPGAGYVHAGAGQQGPVAREIARVGLRALAPALVIVQAGHDDIGAPPRLEQRRVAQAIALIRAEAPRARIALLTVFAGRSRSPASGRTDRAIVTAARTADRSAIIMDPLAAGWTFRHARDGLHPTAAGSAWIARKVAEILRGQGVRTAPAHAQGTSICDYGGPAAAPHGHGPRRNRIRVPPPGAGSAWTVPPWLSAT